MSGTRFRIWLGCAAVGTIVVASVIAALLVHAQERDDFERTQNGEAVRAAHQVEASAEVSAGQLASAAAFYATEGAEKAAPGVGGYSRQEFMAIARSLLGERLLSATGFAAVVPFSRRDSFEHRAKRPIFERRGGEPLPVLPRPEYYPLTNLASTGATQTAPRLLGLDLGSAPGRLAALRRARRSGRASVTGMTPLLTSPGRGIEVYQPVYRAGAPLASRAQRRAALAGFAVGVIRARDLIAAATGAATGTTLQLREGSRIVLGPPKPLADAATAPVPIADRTWILVLSDHDTPSLALPLAIAIAGILLGALIGVLLLFWGRNESVARGIAARRIGERDRAEAERQQTERRYRVLAENSIDMIGVSDLDGQPGLCLALLADPVRLPARGDGRPLEPRVHPSRRPRIGAQPAGELCGRDPARSPISAASCARTEATSGSKPRPGRSPTRPEARSPSSRPRSATSATASACTRSWSGSPSRTR